MKYLVGAILFVLSVVVGKLMNKSYKDKIRFLNEYREFLNRVSGEAGIFKRKMSDIEERFCQERSGKFEDFLKTYRQKGAKTEEEKIVFDFLSEIKEVNAKSQDEFIKYSIGLCEKMLSDREEAQKTNGTLSERLCPLVGAVMFLLVL
ncbi:MAG: hypothetical protein IJ735_00230 [Clostridia bacterium]|nr:hypothetical protein [Clostridia bacterium]